MRIVDEIKSTVSYTLLAGFTVTFYNINIKWRVCICIIYIMQVANHY